MIVIAVFLGFEMSTERDQRLLRNVFNHFSVPNNVFYWAMFVVIVGLCLISFRANVSAGNIRGLSDNPGASVEFTMGYFYRLSVPIAIAFYVSARFAHSRIAKMILFGFFALFTLIIAAGLDRGPIVWILTGVLIYELFSYAQRRGRVTISFKTFSIILILLIVTLWAFDAFGGTRTSSQGITNVAEHYRMNVYMPGGLTWVYIYITTPLENARYAIEYLAGGALTVGAQLFYPFIKIIANCFGLDGMFTQWLSANTTVYAYLKPAAGLTVGSFLMDAIQDFSYFGIIIYPFAYGLMSLFVKSILETSRLSPFTRTIAYALIYQEALWSIFDDTVLFGPILACAAFFLVIDLLATLFTPKRANLSVPNTDSRAFLEVGD